MSTTHTEKYSIKIETDDLANGKHMIVIRNSTKVIVGIPERGLALHDAKARLDGVRYAFEYGIRFAVESTPRVRFAEVQ
jgi:hypothetical protein